ncbi:hypothetical protein GGR56DRAFT_60361 [Xylariaceae sp. FL0804]|nr:hypothetical protein GGR56DRAFT_60361 [Xylariaceae sp. FL0804]
MSSSPVSTNSSNDFSPVCSPASSAPTTRSSSPVSRTTTTTGPVVRRPDTGCTVTLGAGLKPAAVTHSTAASRCRCIPAGTDEELDRLVASAGNAMRMRIMDAEKPSLALAMLLLGGEVVYDK